MKLIQRILTKSGCYRAGKKIAVKGLMIHSVGCPQPKASAFINNWDKADAGACVHAIIEPGGDVYQILPWDYRGWHCGGDANGTHIGVEMTEPATIRYTGGANWTETGDGSNTKNHVLATYKYAVELFAYLCRMYKLNPLADGVIISHSEGCRRGIASNHGDVEHIWNKYGLTMGQFRKDIKAVMDGGAGSNGVVGEVSVSGYTKIMGKAAATVGQMQEYVKRKNPAVAQSILDMAPLYLSEGETEGVRGDVAFAQSCLETGNFTFYGSAVTLGQNNFAGMGVTQNGRKGLSFDTAQLGIRCQIQHLKAYACTEALVNGNIDLRFKYVTRGCAPYVEWLGISENPQGKGWAAGAGYGEKILAILKEIAGDAGDGADSPDNPVQPMSGYVKVFYKNSRYQHPGGGVKKLWGTQSVRSILSDETYIGKVVWNRSEKSITTGKKMLWHDRSEWVVVDGQHEPLVSEELFALANERAKPKKRDRSGVDMSGFKREVLFVCGYCGRSMVKKNHKYCCRYRICGSDTECRRAVEDMETLEGSVMEYVRKTAEVMLGNSRRKDVESERETLGKKLDALRKEKERLSAEKMFLYDKYRSGGMTQEQFKARTGAMAVRIEEIGMEMEEAEGRIERLKGCGSQEGETVLEGITALREFDKGVLRKGIERIRVFGEGRIEVVWKAGDMFGGEKIQ